MNILWLHQAVGVATAVVFLAIALAGLVLWIRNRHAGRVFWGLVAAGQGALGLQVLVGIAMFATIGNAHALHYVYGAFPILVLIFVHRLSKRIASLEWAAFAVASLFIFGLQLRGLMTG